MHPRAALGIFVDCVAAGHPHLVRTAVSALQAQQGEVAAEMAEVHATFCSRMQAAERGKSQLERRLQKALRALDYSVPAQV